MSKSLALIPVALLSLAWASPAQILAIKEPAKRGTNSSASARVPPDDAVRALALSFEDAVQRGARDEAFALFDHEALLERAARGVPATEKVRKHFRDGASAQWRGAAGPVGAAIAAAASGGSVSWYDSNERDGERTVTFRVTRADASAPEYLELILGPRGQKGAIAVDSCSSTDGVTHARVLRRWLLALVADAGRKLPERIAGEDRAFALAGRTFEAIDLSFEAGRSADALAAWATLDERVRRDPSVVLSRLRAALAAGTATFDAVLADVRKSGPTHPSVELFAVDVAILTSRPPLALVALEALKAAGSTDPYLDALRGSILRDLGRADEARTACRRAVEADPRLEDAYWTLLALAIEGQRHDEALAVITSMDARFDVDWQGVSRSPAYAAFLESKPGSRWRTKLASGR